MNRRFNILPGLVSNQEEVIRSLKEKGYYSSGVPRKAERGRTDSATSLPKARRLSPGEMFAQYAEAVRAGRRDQFLKSLSRDQFDALCASLERSKP